MIERHEHLGKLVTDATAQLSTTSSWLVVSTSPAHPASAEFNAASGKDVQRWVGRQVADWPAPIPLGGEHPDVRTDRLSFAPPRQPGRTANSYYYEFHSDGSALGGLQVGTLQNSPPAGEPVWALGEGAVAWITIAMLRLNAAFAGHVSTLGEAAVQVTVICPVDPSPTVPIQVWNHAGGVYGPAGKRQYTSVSSARSAVDLTTCLSPRLAAAARPFLVDLLQQFGVSEPRHVDPSGVVRRQHFTGHDELIHAWADAIGIPSEP
ncbi:hypothetical protein [Streptomyces liliifuscus]|uniref:Uncharacterized protein n=1 Tax=Streptomyces liliifuscus TaxID=2797636 RepID=A0A7T7HZD5_9ACTN|nr:hypothetical protein [Streptomyces liliifuscus]QQM38176.1 hypothetical protein JEQ17_00800 [Streptomyces liliifuscus]